MPSWISCADRQQPCAVEVLDDRAPRAAAAEAGGAEPVECPVAPGASCPNDSDSHHLLRSAAVLSRIVLLCARRDRVPRPAGCGAGARATTRSSRPSTPSPTRREQVAGPDAEVVNLTPPGAEPHDLELTPRDVGRVQDAALVVYVGDGFQPAVQQAVEGRSGPSLDVLDGVDLRPASRAGEGLDPHVWLDPIRFAAIARGDRAGARLARPRRTASSRGSTRSTRATAAACARCMRREIVTSHAAFGYLAARYGLEQVPLVGLQPEAEPGAAGGRAARRRRSARPARRRCSRRRSRRRRSPTRSRARPA